MKSYELPPREKIHEAISAIADNRIVITGENQATVLSSDGSKKYIVEWANNIYSSNDNATYWKGYAGYPIIAVLLLNNKISYNNEYTMYFKGINWKQLNTKYKNNYALAVEQFYHDLEAKGINIKDLDNEISKIYHDLSNLDIEIKRSNYFPPK